MKKEIKTEFNKLYVVEDFISDATSDFLSKCFDSNLKEFDRYPNIKYGPSQRYINSTNSFEEYGDNPEYNMGLDLFTSICTSISEVVSDIYNEPFGIKHAMYAAMYKDGVGDLHMDNHYISQKNELKAKKYDRVCRSALLYFTDNYEGGELNFPRQQIKYKPKKNSLIIFEGDHTLPHQVLQVTSGERKNFICFLSPKKDIDINEPSIQEEDGEIFLTEEIITDPNIMGTL
jgi:hypothetical protein